MCDSVSSSLMKGNELRILDANLAEDWFAAILQGIGTRFKADVRSNTCSAGLPI